MNQNAATKAGAALSLNQLVEQIHSREDFVTFVRAFLCHLQQKPKEWENHDLASFLDALAAWVEDMDGYYHNLGERVPDQPTWRMLGQILLAARAYE